MLRGLIIGVALWAPVGAPAFAVDPKLSASGVTVKIEDVEKAISRAGVCLVGMVQDDGMFIYRVNMNPDVRVKRRYNILRHAGAIYALCDYYHYRPDSKTKEAIECAGRYLIRESMGPVEEWSNTLAVWSKPEVNGSGKPLQAKLGGTGLGLVALLSIEKVRPGFNSLSNLQALGRFVSHMREEDGSICSKYIPSEGGKNGEWVSLYYPGEAALGLLMLYEMDGSKDQLQTATDVLLYLARLRRGRADIPADHWALLATAKLIDLRSERLSRSTIRELVDHAVQICEVILDEQVTDSGQPLIYGGFDGDGRTTPTATRLEGLLAVRRILSREHELLPRVNEAIMLGINFLLRAQVKDGPFAGAFTRAVRTIDPDAPEARSFNRRATEVRIDYIQHALSAMIEYKRVSGRITAVPNGAKGSLPNIK